MQIGGTVVTPPPLVISPSAQKTFAGPTTTTSTDTGVTNVTDTGTTDTQGPLVEQPPEPQGPTMEDMCLLRRLHRCRQHMSKTSHNSNNKLQQWSSNNANRWQ